MLDIKVYQERAFRGFRELSAGLRIVNEKSVASAILPGAWNHKIPVSEELALTALGAQRVPCPYSNQTPSPAFFGIFEREGYSSYGVPTEDFQGGYGNSNSLLRVECTLCGFGRYYVSDLNPWATDNEGYTPVIHPPTTYLKSVRPEKLITNASWHDDHLDLPTEEEGRLIVCISGPHFKREKALEAARRRFPRADPSPLAQLNGYIVLQEGIRTG